jgi:methionyl-tRNA synthetase
MMPQASEQRLHRAEAALEKQIAIVQLVAAMKQPKLLEMAERLLATLELNVETARETQRIRHHIHRINEGMR